MKTSILLSMISICLILGGFAPAQSSMIYVSGDVSGTWSADTVVVTGEVRVPPLETLTIEPGVKVYFWVYCKFIVDNGATLHAVGTVSDSIYFDEHWQWPGNRWHGIRFLNDSNSSQLAYCHFKHGLASGGGEDDHGGAIYCNASSLSIHNCLIEGCSANSNGGGIYCANNSNGSINNNTICGNSAAWGGGIFANSSNPSISNNTISNNTVWGNCGGIACYNNSSPTISNNILSANSAYYWPNDCGGIGCYYSSNPTISENVISGNSGSYYGGGIGWFYSSSPTITANTINGNSAYAGGGLASYGGHATVSNNAIYGNWATMHGGGILGWGQDGGITINSNFINSNSTSGTGGGIYLVFGNIMGADTSRITSNQIIENTANFGGGIYGEYCEYLTFHDNIIIGNTANSDGGGIYFTISPDSFNFNVIGANTASNLGGGMYLGSVSFSMNKSTIAYNSAPTGDGLYLSNSSVNLNNSILWGNGSEQISQAGTSNAQVTYSDIQGFWPGTGNINSNPLFVASSQNEFQLQWNSPCINTGDPNPIYNDPDGSRADMGAFYYDPSINYAPVIVSYYPTDIDTVNVGETIDFEVHAIDPNGDNLSFRWTLNGTVIGQDSTQTLTFANAGFYSVWAYASDGFLADSVYWGFVAVVPVINAAPEIISYYPTDLDTVEVGSVINFGVTAIDPNSDSLLFRWTSNGTEVGYDSTMTLSFENEGSYDIWAFVSDGQLADSINWSVTVTPMGVCEKPGAVEYYFFVQNSPNPFNPSTVIRYQIPDARLVSLRVYDTAGRLVETLVNGYREVGVHEVTFDGSALPSGVYLYRLEAGEYHAAGKMVLLK